MFIYGPLVSLIHINDIHISGTIHHELEIREIRLSAEATGFFGLGNGLAPNRRQAIIWANADPIHWRIYAALGGDDLKPIEA